MPKRFREFDRGGLGPWKRLRSGSVAMLLVLARIAIVRAFREE
jgi:hypothetical protein